MLCYSETWLHIIVEVNHCEEQSFKRNFWIMVTRVVSNFVGSVKCSLFLLINLSLGLLFVCVLCLSDSSLKE